ncbi:MAG: TlyA family RNA methyltransferase [Nitrospirota bacterium]|jgi:23S rRNA (cytidine1920-2'-O)/16S rRNA (cytidine1409-2'-O)-methyltransferase
MAAKTLRLDHALVEHGLAESRSRAQSLIRAGVVLVNDHVVDKPAHPVHTDDRLRLRGTDHAFVSRGGMKLAAALDAFDIDVTGGEFLDAGASTGGFTDCLLQRGAARVVAVDVGYGQLAWSLRQDPRVEVCERTHVLRLPVALRERRFDGITCDLSFISLRAVVPELVPMLRPGGALTLLIKPQFEVGREAVGKGGVVRDPVARQEAIDQVRQLTADLGLSIVGVIDSPIRGPKGNLEALLVARMPG